MRHRRWWPSDTYVRSKDQVSTADIINTACHAKANSLKTRSISTVSGAATQPCVQEMKSQQEADPTSPSDWQSALLQKLLSNHHLPTITQRPASSSQVNASGSAAPTCYSFPASTSASGAAAFEAKPLYMGIFLDALSTARLLAWAPPRHSSIFGNHVVLLQRPSYQELSTLPLGQEVQLPVMAKTENVAVQVTLAMQHIAVPKWFCLCIGPLEPVLCTL